MFNYTSNNTLIVLRKTQFVISNSNTIKLSKQPTKAMQVMWTLALHHHPTAATREATNRYRGHMQESSLSCFAVVGVVRQTHI